MRLPPSIPNTCLFFGTALLVSCSGSDPSLRREQPGEAGLRGKLPVGQLWMRALGPYNAKVGGCPSVGMGLGKGTLVGQPLRDHLRGQLPAAMSARAWINRQCVYTYQPQRGSLSSSHPTAAQVLKASSGKIVPLPLTMSANGVFSQSRNLLRDRTIWQNLFLNRAGAVPPLHNQGARMVVSVIDDLEHSLSLPQQGSSIFSIAQRAQCHGQSTGPIHGAAMASLLYQLTCPTIGHCPFEVKAFKALDLSYDSGTGLPQTAGCQTGDSLSVFSAILRSLKTHADSSAPGVGHVINLSIGMNFGETDTYMSNGGPSLAQILAAGEVLQEGLRAAACNNAVTVVATGNGYTPGVAHQIKMMPAGVANSTDTLDCYLSPKYDSSPFPSSSIALSGTMLDVGAQSAGEEDRQTWVINGAVQSTRGRIPLQMGRRMSSASAMAYGHNAYLPFGVGEERLITGTSVAAAITSSALALSGSYCTGNGHLRGLIEDLKDSSRYGWTKWTDKAQYLPNDYTPYDNQGATRQITIKSVLSRCKTNLPGDLIVANPPALSTLEPHSADVQRPGSYPEINVLNSREFVDSTANVASNSYQDTPLLTPQPEPVGPCGDCRLDQPGDVFLDLVDFGNYGKYRLDLSTDAGYIQIEFEPQAPSMAGSIQQELNNYQVQKVYGAKVTALNNQTGKDEASEVVVF